MAIAEIIQRAGYVFYFLIPCKVAWSKFAHTVITSLNPKKPCTQWKGSHLFPNTPGHDL
jgi:hypothetical protein